METDLILATDGSRYAVIFGRYWMTEGPQQEAEWLDGDSHSPIVFKPTHWSHFAPLN